MRGRAQPGIGAGGSAHPWPAWAQPLLRPPWLPKSEGGVQSPRSWVTGPRICKGEKSPHGTSVPARRRVGARLSTLVPAVT